MTFERIDRRVRLATLIGLLAVLLAAGVPTAYAATTDGPTIAADIGISIPVDADFRNALGRGTYSYKVGGVVSGAIGWRLSDYRVELNATWAWNDLDQREQFGVSLPMSGKQQTLTGMLNGYYDFNSANMFRPYVGGGLGVVYAKLEANSLLIGGEWIDDTDTQFAYNLMAGLGIYFTDHIILDIGYKFTQTSVATFDSIGAGLIPTNTTISILRNDFTAGLRLEF
jgi:opacity protein-like surface antigen